MNYEEKLVKKLRDFTALAFFSEVAIRSNLSSINLIANVKI